MMQHIQNLRKNQNSTNLYPKYNPKQNGQSELQDEFAHPYGGICYSNSGCTVYTPKRKNSKGESDQESNKNILQTIQNENYKLLYHLCFRG